MSWNWEIEAPAPLRDRRPVPDSQMTEAQFRGKSQADVLKQIARHIKRLGYDPEQIDVFTWKDHEEAPWPVVRASVLIET